MPDSDAPRPISPVGDLAERAAEIHVVVVGAGIAGLIAARTFAKVGMRVTVLEAAAHPGGTIGRAELDGLALDTGADSFSIRGGHVQRLLEELQLAHDVVSPEPLGTWLAGVPGAGAVPFPSRGILGIPENPFADDVRRIIGWRGAWRAYLDRLRPPLTIGQEKSLGRLVESRMGALVRDRLVAPLTEGVYGSHPDDIDTDAAAPGLNAALTRTGSLSGAVGLLLAEREERTESSVQGLDGGLHRLVDALADELALLGAELRTATAATAVERTASGWEIRTAADDDAPIAADAVVLATPAPIAERLLAEELPELGLPGPASEIEVVTLLLEAPALDAAPRGSGVRTVPGTTPVRALGHSTAVWAGLRSRAAGRHIVRVTFGAQGEAPATAGRDDADAAGLALREASALLGVPEDRLTFIASHREGFTQPPPSSALGAAEARRRARKRIAAVPGLGMVGAWLAGTGLAQVIPDAEQEAERLRHALLWDAAGEGRPSA